MLSDISSQFVSGIFAGEKLDTKIYCVAVADTMLTAVHPAPFRSSSFRWLLAGRTINSLGSAISPVAYAFAVLDLGGSATDLGLVVASYALVEVITTLFGGVFGDRLRRTLLMQGAAGLAAVFQGITAVGLIGGWATVPLLAVMSGLNGCLIAISGPSSRAVVPQTVSPEGLQTAVSALRLSQNTAMVVGFSAAGILVALVGSGWAIVVDAVTFGAAAGCYAAVRVPPLSVSAKQPLLSDLRAGAVEVFRHTWLWILILQALVYHLVYAGAQGVLGPIVVGNTFGEAAWGWSLGAVVVGFVVGGIVTLRYRPRRMLFVGTAYLSLTACFPLAMGLQLDLPLILLGAFLHGFGLEIFSVNWDLAIQQNVPPDRLARVFAFDQMGSFVMRPLGLALTGPVAEAVGAERWLVVIAAVMFISTVLALSSRSVRHLRTGTGSRG